MAYDEPFDSSIFDVPSGEEDELFCGGDEFDREAAADVEPAPEDPQYDSDEDYENYEDIQGSARKLFNPKVDDWDHSPFTEIPTVHLDKARTFGTLRKMSWYIPE